MDEETGEINEVELKGLDALKEMGDEPGDLDMVEMTEIALALCSKNERIGKGVTDFFTQKLSEGKKLLKRLDELTTKQMEAVALKIAVSEQKTTENLGDSINS